MGTTIVLNKEQLVKKLYQGAIIEKKVLGFPQEESPVKPYSNIFYWSHLASEYGSLLEDHPILGFNILIYVLKGTYESLNHESGKWTSFNEGEVELIQAGKGIKYSGKLFPNTEILQVWIDPDLNMSKKMNSILTKISLKEIPVKNIWDKTSNVGLKDIEACRKISQNVTFQLLNLEAGFHTFKSLKNTSLSGYIVGGYIEIDDVLMGYGDFFLDENKKELKITSLVDCKILLVTSPYEPSYLTYTALQTQEMDG